MSSLKKQAISGVFWTFTQQFSVQIINFVVQIILARLLMPEMFGLIAMLTVFINIGQTLMDSGMTSSLIRTKGPDQLDYSTVFMTNMIISIAVYIITYVGAPWVAIFYNQPILKDILRVYSITFVIRAFVAVHVAKLTKEMNFKTQMILQVPSTIIGAIIGVTMAYLGYGVWSLVFMNLVQTVVFTIQNWIFIPWRPSFVFNKEKFKEHFKFGYKLTLASLLDTIYRNIYPMVVGKAFTPTTVGYFNQAETMRNLPVIQLSSVIGKVTYPLFSNIKNDEQLKNAYRTIMKLIFFIVVPMMMILIIVGKELFIFLFGEKWLPAVPYFQILSIASIVRPLGTYNLNILRVKGRSDLNLKLEILKKSLGFIVLLASVPFGMTTLVVLYMIVSHFFTFINMYFSGRLINYFFWEQVKDSSRIYFFGIIAITVSYLSYLQLINITTSNFIIMVTITIIYLGAYLPLVYLFERDLILTIKKLIKDK